MKKVCLIFVLLSVCLLLCSCTKKEAVKTDEFVIETEKTDSLTTLSDIRDEILTELKVEDSMPIETDSLNSLYGIDSSVVKQSASFVTMSGTFPHEVIMIEAVDKEAVKTVEAALEKKLAEVRVQSKSYDATNYKLAQQCKVNIKGNFVTLLLSPDHAQIQKILDKYI